MFEIAQDSNRFCIIAPMFNAEKTIREFLCSIFGQSYRNWRLVLIDDCSDKEQQYSCSVIIQLFQNIDHELAKNVSVHWNDCNGRGKQWEMSNVLYGISLCNDDDVICRIDADDVLCDLDALNILNTYYKSTGCDVAWTKHRWNLSDRNISDAMPPNADVYKHQWVSSHLKTFRKRLINNMPYENFINMDGDLVKRAGDQAMYLPVLHRAKKRLFIPRVMYKYSIDEKGYATYQTEDAKFQKREADFVRNRGYVSSGISWEEKLGLGGKSLDDFTLPIAQPK